MAHFLSRLLSAAVMVLAAVSADAAETRKKPPRETPKATHELPMKLVIVRGDDKDCEPYCPEWIMAEGKITGETPKAFHDALLLAKQRSGGANLPIVIHSYGGNILAALQIGYFLRARRVDVAVGMTAYSGCGPFSPKCAAPQPDGAYRGRIVSRQAICVSACPLILAAGIRRLASADASVGVHHWGYEQEPGKDGKPRFARQGKQVPWDRVVRKMITDYLAATGISPDLASDMDRTPFSSMKFYNMRRRTQLALVTEDKGAQWLAGGRLCGLTTRPAHCVLPGNTMDYRRALAETGISDQAEPMTVVIVRDERKECEPLCLQWIVAKGAIRPDTPKLFRKVLARTGKMKLPLVIDSRGGDFDAALEIGRMIRKRGLDVVVGNFTYAGCMAGSAPCGKPDLKGFYRGVPSGRYDGCHGACVFVLAAGVRRVLPEGFDLKLSPSRSYVSRAEPARSERRLDDYLSEMGVSTLLMKRLAWTERNIYYRHFTGETARSLKLVTSLDSSAYTSAPAGICAGPERPPHCVRRR